MERVGKAGAQLIAVCTFNGGKVDFENYSNYYKKNGNRNFR